MLLVRQLTYQSTQRCIQLFEWDRLEVCQRVDSGESQHFEKLVARFHGASGRRRVANFSKAAPS
jgi:hypothetical protein